MFNQPVTTTIMGPDGKTYLIEGPSTITNIDGYRHYLAARRQKAFRGRSLVRELGGGDAA